MCAGTVVHYEQAVTFCAWPWDAALFHGVAGGDIAPGASRELLQRELRILKAGAYTRSLQSST